MHVFSLKTCWIKEYNYLPLERTHLVAVFACKPGDWVYWENIGWGTVSSYAEHSTLYKTKKKEVKFFPKHCLGIRAVKEASYKARHEADSLCIPELDQIVCFLQRGAAVLWRRLNSQPLPGRIPGYSKPTSFAALLPNTAYTFFFVCRIDMVEIAS